MDLDPIDPISDGSSDGDDHQQQRNDGNVSVPSFLFDPVDLQYELSDRIRAQGGVMPLVEILHQRSNAANSISTLGEWSCLDDSIYDNSTSNNSGPTHEQRQYQRDNQQNPSHESSVHSNSNSDILAMTISINAGSSPEQVATREFIASKAMVAVRDLQDIGTTIEVKGDGNCGIYSIVLGLFHLRHPDYYASSATERQVREHLRERLDDPYVTRLALYTHLQQNVASFNSDHPNIRRVHDACGNCLRDFKAPAEKILREPGFIGRRMWSPFVNYDEGVGIDHWLDVNHHIPLVASKYACSVVCYFSLGPNLPRNTTIAHYEDGQVFMHFIEGDFYSPPKGTPAICLRYVNGNHFQFLRTLDYDGPEWTWQDIFNDDDDSLNGLLSANYDVKASVDSSLTAAGQNEDVASMSFSLSHDDNSIMSLSSSSSRGSDGDGGGAGGAIASPFRPQLEDDAFDVSDKKSTSPHPYSKKLSAVAAIDLTYSTGDDANESISHQRKYTDERLSSVDNKTKQSPQMLRHVSDVVGRRNNVAHHSNFQKKTKSGGKSYVHFEPFKKKRVYKVKVPSIELSGKLVIQHDGTQVKKVEFCKSWTNRSPWFINQIKPAIPNHVSLVSKGSKCLKVRNTRRNSFGKNPTHTNLVKFWGVCAGGDYKKNNLGRDDLCCTTEWVAGIDEPNVKHLALNPFDSSIELQIQFNGQCIHEEGKVIGQLRGPAREEAVKEVRK